VTGQADSHPERTGTKPTLATPAAGNAVQQAPMLRTSLIKVGVDATLSEVLAVLSRCGGDGRAFDAVAFQRIGDEAAGLHLLDEGGQERQRFGTPAGG
jgi:hypothetical protein